MCHTQQFSQSEDIPAHCVSLVIVLALFSGVGEPPQCLSCSALFAVKRAIESARAEIGKDTVFTLSKL